VRTESERNSERSDGSLRYCDALIIGAGPAGVSCAVWLARLGFAPLLIEAGSRIGGLCLGHSYHDNWNASLPGRTGLEVAEQLALSVRQARVSVCLNEPVSKLEAAADYAQPADSTGAEFIATTASGKQWRAPHAVLASGVRARSLPELDARDDAPSNRIEPLPGILVGPGAHVAAQDFTGKRVAVLGGGDNAFENALYALERGAASTDLYARSVRAQQQFVRRFPPAHVYSAPAALNLEQRQVNGRPYDLILVCHGWEPCAAFTDALTPARNARGFIQTDWVTAQTSVPNLYAIGEVAQRQHPCVVTALADGVTAAKAIQASLERDCL